VNSPPTIATVVEGHGEVKALPVLLRRIAYELLGVPYVLVPPPYRVKRNRMTQPAELSPASRFQSVRVADRGGVLVLADADDDCAVNLAADLRQAAQPTPVEVAIAVREFEAWFLGAVESLRGHSAVRDDAVYDGNPERPRAAKGVLEELMTEPYRETLHQPAFAAMVDIQQAQEVRSFAHLVTCVDRLLKEETRVE
jgi:hypothetical protein